MLFALASALFLHYLRQHRRLAARVFPVAAEGLMSIASPPTINFRWVILPLKMPRICTSLNVYRIVLVDDNTNASRAKGCKPVYATGLLIAFEQWKAGRQK